MADILKFKLNTGKSLDYVDGYNTGKSQDYKDGWNDALLYVTSVVETIVDERTDESKQMNEIDVKCSGCGEKVLSTGECSNFNCSKNN